MRKRAVMLAALLMALGGVAVVPGTATGIGVGQWQFNPTTKNHYMQTEPMTWADAEAHAVSLGGHLVTINDQAEQDWLEATFTQPLLRIGFNDIAAEGIWVWSSGEPVTYTDWLSGEPNNCGFWTPEVPICQDEDAAVINYSDWQTGTLGWNDLSADAQQSAIIEVPAVTGRETNGAATRYTFWWPGATTSTCTGVRVANKVSVKDTETCLMSGYTDGFIAGTYRGNPTGPLPPYGDTATWKSDFDGRVATSWKITFLDNGNRTFTANIVAYY